LHLTGVSKNPRQGAELYRLQQQTPRAPASDQAANQLNAELQSRPPIKMLGGTHSCHGRWEQRNILVDGIRQQLESSLEANGSEVHSPPGHWLSAEPAIF
jgi:hypothetical protein